jgi:hypothetical protein
MIYSVPVYFPEKGCGSRAVDHNVGLQHRTGSHYPSVQVPWLLKGLSSALYRLNAEHLFTTCS